MKLRLGSWLLYRGADEQHEPSVEHAGDLGVPQIAARVDEKRCRFPALSVVGHDHSNRAVATDVVARLTKGAEPLVLMANQIGEGVMFTPVSDLFHGHQRRSLAKADRRTAERHHSQTKETHANLSLWQGDALPI
jgi:hypothetical protein